MLTGFIKLPIVVFFFSNLCFNQAAKKGVDSTWTGLIFGIFELAMAIASLIIGNFVSNVFTNSSLSFVTKVSSAFATVLGDASL
jgi:L-cysteine desulfidase